MCKLVGCASRANYIHSQSCAHRVATEKCIHPRKPCEELDVQCGREELREKGAKQELEDYNIGKHCNRQTMVAVSGGCLWAEKLVGRYTFSLS